MLQRSLVFALSLTLLIVGATPLVRRTDAMPADVVDGGWPRAYVGGTGARITLYQPQVVSWSDQKHMVMYAAVAYTGKDRTSTALGTIRIEADTKVAVAERLVNFSEFRITSSNFPTLGRERLTAIVAEINNSIPHEERIIGLDRVLAAVNMSEIVPKNAKDVKADAPHVFVSTTPAILVNLDGDPIWSPIKGSDLRFAVNTNWDLFEDRASNRFLLRVDQEWLEASSVDGPWKTAVTLPASVFLLPADDNWKDTRAALAHPAPARSSVPTVFVSRAPAEMVLLKGPPVYVAVPGTQLLWVSNTESDVFRAGKAGSVYLLVSGRWFSAPSFEGPWTFATPHLPEDFKRIPLEHPRSHVLASVPGTTQALEAVLLAQVPQIARVSRTEVKAPDVIYDGAPRFEAILGTVSRAVNTDKQILRVGDAYYMCLDGVWFVSANPTGPWKLADAVPDPIYQIPISSPAYNVTHVTVESADADAVVYEADAAYTGMMVAWGCAVWGTGWYYPPYLGWGGYYPVYYPWYPSYGYGAWYNPWTGSYTRAGATYGPYGGAGYAARYNPRTGTYSRAAAAWGPGGARGAAEAWNPRTGTSAQTRQGANVFGSWGSTAVQRGDQWARTARVTNRATGTTTRATTGSGGGGAISRRGTEGRTTVGRTGGGDVFAGRDGNVYRREGESWQKYENGGWNNVERPTGTSGLRDAEGKPRVDQNALSNATRDQLNKDFASRRDGAQRTNDLGSVRSRGGSSSRGAGGAGSYRPSGGGFRSGGFRGGGFRGGGRR